jgi:benzoyl-CoA reductase/2-hydroxyglutaryl-CoA dehydratase subunit BcrC/BadD/HgdB
MAEEFLYRQIKETLIPTLEDVCGKPFDYDRMWQILITTKKAAMLRKQCMELFKVIPAPWTLWDSGISIAPVVHLAGKPEAVAYMEKLKAELDHRVANKIPAILPEERYRLYWDNFLPWAFLGKIIRKLVPFGAIPVCGRYPFMFAPHPEHIPDEPVGDPVRVWVEGIYRYGERVFGVPEIALQAVSRQVEEHSVDGLIMFTSKSCRIFNLGQQDILDEIERRYGIPGVIIEGDMVDSKMLSEAQIDTRLQALFETIEGRRRAKRRWV